MVFTLVKLNDGFMVGKPNTLRPSLKMTIPQPLLTTAKPLDVTSSGITLIVWLRAKRLPLQNQKPCVFKNLSHLSMSTRK